MRHLEAKWIDLTYQRKKEAIGMIRGIVLAHGPQTTYSFAMAYRDVVIHVVIDHKEVEVLL